MITPARHPRATAAALLACLANAALARSSSPAEDAPPLRLRWAERLESTPRNLGPTADVAPESLLAGVRLNGVDRGEFGILRIGAEYHLPAGDLARLGIAVDAVAGLPRRTVDAADWISLTTLGGRNIRFDESNLVLYTDLPIGLLSRQQIELPAQGPTSPLSNPAGKSAFLNYQWSASRISGADGFSTLRLTTELGVRIAGGLLRSYQAIVRDAEDTDGRRRSQTLRYATQWVFDDRERLVRWTVGDFLASSGMLGGSANLGGLSVERFFGMDPRLVRNPLAQLSAQTLTPAEVTVSYRGIPLLRQNVNPGAIDIRNLYLTSGARDLDISVRDAFGRIENITVPFYFSDEVLRKGLTEFSFQAGKVRRAVDGDNDRYEDTALLGFWRHGLSDNVTLGWRAEADGAIANAGASAYYRHDRLGVLGWNASYGGARHPHRFASAMQGSYAYQTVDTGVRLTLQNVGRDYRVLNGSSTDADPLRLLRQARASFFLTLPHIGIVSFDATQGVRASGDRMAERSISWSHNVGKGLILLAGYRQSREETRHREAFLSLSWNLDPTLNANVNVRSQDHSDRQAGVSYSRSVPLGLGLGYRLDADADRSGGFDSKSWRGFAQYNFERTSMAAEVRLLDATGGRTRTYSADWTGALAWVDGHFGFSRAINDSFAMVALSEPLAGVRVYQNGQAVGHTDTQGELVLPSLASYQANTIVLEHKDVPFDFTFGDLQNVIVPAYRSGHLWRLDVYRAQAYTGKLMVRQDGRLTTASPGEGSLVVDGKRVTFLIGSDGDFFMERLKAGRYRGTVTVDGKVCEFGVSLPASSELLINIGEVVACE